MAKYAEGTDVSVDRSRAEIIHNLTRYGVKKFGWDQQDEADVLFFELNTKAYRITIQKPKASEFEYNPRVTAATYIDREWRRRWRAHGMMLKMRLEFAESGDSTTEQELLPFLILEGGATVGEALEAGRLPLLGAGRKA